MHTYRIPHSDLEVSRIAYGCMHLSRAWDDTAITAGEISAALRTIATAVDLGITLFDHADIYARGKSEQLFGEALRRTPGLRDRIVLQSKCGIRFGGDPDANTPGRYDFSREHLLRSVEGSLSRLGTGHLDLLLLHRPDPLAEPEEVASAFDQLQRSGKVRHFGVSNHSASQISLLQKYVDQPLVANQIELSLLHHYPVSEGVLFNRLDCIHADAAGTLDYCREHGILVQAWAPLASGKFSPPLAGMDEPMRSAAVLVQKMAREKNVSAEAILTAWLLRHPAGIQPIVGTTDPARLTAVCAADELRLTREEWYALLTAMRGQSVP
ncbi:aldo/keto reductase [Pseudoxanthomonas sacheonensis]|uniref:aldo/keto reductase n=1 Tax=Pseudoxanthomonas sacheonensis TaxID=443615 RepID=UPI0013D1E256|nr:aldo/keto reductase [Pseudoxanthomonas sacheonensis]KAF1707157.1 aldo/keto reductase [Pseudoxanthomonas sacheonensis]